jgi:hypothetical protein
MNLLSLPRLPCARRPLLCAAVVLSMLEIAHAAPPAGPVARMTVVQNKDLNGTVYKKLGLPERQYCWDACLKEDRCTGVRWGVIEGDTAGLCLLMTGPLSLKDPVVPRTEDGKPILVVGARKEAAQGS